MEKGQKLYSVVSSDYTNAAPVLVGGTIERVTKMYVWVNTSALSNWSKRLDIGAIGHMGPERFSVVQRTAEDAWKAFIARTDRSIEATQERLTRLRTNLEIAGAALTAVQQ